jgi:ribulose-phosphate 3-epimerase
MDKTILTSAKRHMIAPSFLAANFLKIEDETQWLNSSDCDLIHLDVMDGQFVPNISYGLPVIAAIHRVSTKPLDVHLMMHRPEYFIEDFRKAGADIITVHYETCVHLHRTIAQIKESGALAGVALNPHTSVDLLDDVLEDIDLALVMSVNPGFGGQKFIYRSLHKIETLKTKIIHRNLRCKIEVDGGVGLQNAERILAAGADILVAGSAIFKSEDRDDTLRRLKDISI